MMLDPSLPYGKSSIKTKTVMPISVMCYNRSGNNLVMAESALVATVEVNDLVVVQTKGSILVANKNLVQDV